MPDDALDRLAALLDGRRVAVLTGAGLSTDSGIPDYRGPGTRAQARRPIQYDDFVRDAAARQRYWARSTAGWPRVARARPNAAHQALARMEAAGLVTGVITQNVDGLHGVAGSRDVVELHGSLAHVRCLACGGRFARSWLQDEVARLNPDRPLTAPAAPDGDADLADAHVAAFRVPDCPACGGVLKPDVVFFGETVPKPTVAEAWRLYDAGDVLLVAGSSLAVFSGYRFVLRAEKDGKPSALVTIGETRADDRVTLKVDAPLGVVLPALADRLGAPAA